MRLQARLFSCRSALSSLLFVTPLLFSASAGHADISPVTQAEAAKANNLGTALMNQQLLEKAAAKFGDAFQLDPSLVRAEVNRGIALVYLQKMPEAEQALEHAATLDPKDPHIWYALGILYRIEAEYPAGPGKFSEGSRARSR